MKDRSKSRATTKRVRLVMLEDILRQYIELGIFERLYGTRYGPLPARSGADEDGTEPDSRAESEQEQ